jgi:hypothetical protein
MSQSPFVGPIAPENNPPINPQYFQPSRFEISSITRGSTTLVQTTLNNNYVIGQLVRLIIPFYCGCSGLNEQQGYVIEIPSANEVVVNINSLNQNSFIAPPAGTTVVPQILAIGDVNSGIISSTARSIPTTNIPGSFINISPQ